MDLLRQLEVQLKEKTRVEACLLGVEFPFDEELFGKPGKLRGSLDSSREKEAQLAVDRAAEVNPRYRGKSTAEGSGTAGHD